MKKILILLILLVFAVGCTVYGKTEDFCDIHSKILEITEGEYNYYRHITFENTDESVCSHRFHLKSIVTGDKYITLGIYATDVSKFKAMQIFDKVTKKRIGKTKAKVYENLKKDVTTQAVEKELRELVKETEAKYDLWEDDTWGK